MQFLPEDYQLLLAGGAETREDRAILQSCQDLARQLGLEGRVRFLGVRTDVPSLLAASDAIVLSSHYEGRPLSALEAMAAGKVFIASDVEGLHGLVEGAGILFPRGNAEALAGRIREGCENVELAEIVRKKCLNKAKTYNIGDNSQSYLDIYQNLIKFEG